MRTIYKIEDRLFDLVHRVRTGGTIAAQDLSTPDFIDAKPHATAFQSVWCRNLRVLIGAARTAAPLTTFVDIGAGKGKACFYAAAAFERVIGVEFSGDLVAAARENLRRSGLRNVEFICADAAAYELPAAPALVFLFNPFDRVVLGSFLARNIARMQAQGSLVAYANDRERQVLQQWGFECVLRDPRRCISLWQPPSGAATLHEPPDLRHDAGRGGSRGRQAAEVGPNLARTIQDGCQFVH
jgi:SAM-dependent methyltransferase